jgi:hypothetical protein
MDDLSHPDCGGDGASGAETNGLEARRAELRAAVKRGLADIEEGRVVDLGEALDRIEAMLDELEAARPAQVCPDDVEVLVPRRRAGSSGTGERTGSRPSPGNNSGRSGRP